MCCLTGEVSRPQNAGRLERRVRPKAQKRKLPHRPRTTKTIAACACCTRARSQKSLKLAQPTQAKPERTPNTQRINACEGKWHLNIHGLKRAGIKGRLTIKVSG